jgi:hypothetical protein
MKQYEQDTADMIRRSIDRMTREMFEPETFPAHREFLEQCIANARRELASIHAGAWADVHNPKVTA